MLLMENGPEAHLATVKPRLMQAEGIWQTVLLLEYTHMQRCSSETAASQYQELVNPVCFSFFQVDAQDLYPSLRYAFQHHFATACLQVAQYKTFGMPLRHRLSGKEYRPVGSAHIFFHWNL
jgi:hypothetical protein